MLENRSFDNMCGLALPGCTPGRASISRFLGTQALRRITSGLFNPVQESYFTTAPGKSIRLRSANATNMPNPDPEEDFPNVNYQLFGPEAPNQAPKWPNLGFVIKLCKGDRDQYSGPDYATFQPRPGSGNLRSCSQFRDQRCVVLFRSEQYVAEPKLFPRGYIEWQRCERQHSEPAGVERAHGLQRPREHRRELASVQRYCHHTSPDLADVSTAMALSLDRFLHFDDFKSDRASGSLPQYSSWNPAC